MFELKNNVENKPTSHIDVWGNDFGRNKNDEAEGWYLKMNVNLITGREM